MSLRRLGPLALLLVLLPVALAIQANLAGVIDWHEPKIGLPRLSQRSTAPSFHGSPGTEASILTLTKSNVLASLNATDGSIFWRHLAPEGETFQSYHPNASAILLLSTARDATVVRLLDATTGRYKWESTLRAPALELASGSKTSTDVSFVADGSGDVLVLAFGTTLTRLDGISGALKWRWLESGDNHFIRIAPTPLNPSRLALVGSQRRGQAWDQTLQQIDSQDGSGIIQTTIRSASPPYPATLLLSTLDVPYAIWLHDAHIFSTDLRLADGSSSVLSSGHLPAYRELLDVGLESQGIFLGLRLDGTADLLRVVNTDIILFWSFTESRDASDASASVYAGFLDASGTPFVTRTFWSYALGLANIHLYSVNGAGGQGMFSGRTFVFDTLSHGVILHTGIFVSSAGEFDDRVKLLATTSTGAIQLFDHGILRFTREESLASIKSVTFVDLPEREELAADTLSAEAYWDRLLRHTTDLQRLPGYLLRFIGRFTSASSSVVVTGQSERELWRDQFGFRKLIIVGTSTGKVFGLDSASGGIVWSRLLGKSVAESGSSFAISGLWTTRPAQTGGRPVVAIVGASSEGATPSLLALEIDALSGELLDRSDAAPPHFPLRAQEIIALDAEEPGSAEKTLVFLDESLKLHALQQTDAIISKIAEGLVIIRPRSQGARQGLDALLAFSHASPQVLWTLAFAPGEILSDVTSTPGGPVTSFGRVLGDRSSLYKYLNPNLVAASSVSTTSGHGTVYVVDSVRGTVIYQASHANVDSTDGIRVMLTDNWLVYHYRLSNDGVSPSGGHRIVSVELFERGSKEDKIGSSDLSSFSPDHEVNVAARAFVLPRNLRALTSTTTKHRITTRDVIAADDRGQIFAIAHRWLDPRRPMGKPSAIEKEEMLAPYDPILPIDSKRVLSHKYHLLGVSAIATSPALLESTSLVFAYGLDLFSTRVTPSGTFDLLSDSFNKVQLVLTILGLSVGIVIVRPIINRKRSRGRWF